MTHYTPMPNDLANLKSPTREEAISYMESRRLAENRPRTFEQTTIGKQVVNKTMNYSPDFIALERAKFDKAREAEIADKTMTLNRMYEERLATKQRIEASNAKAFGEEKARLREAYLAQPGATEADFEKALPSLLEAKRQQAVLNADADWELQKAAFRSKHGF